MADFIAVLRKTIDGLGENTPEMREKVFEKARATVEARLGAMNPPPPAAVADRQRKALEDAIAVVRNEYEVAAGAEDFDSDLESAFASLAGTPAHERSRPSDPLDEAPPDGPAEELAGPETADAAPIPADPIDDPAAEPAASPDVSDPAAEPFDPVQVEHVPTAARSGKETASAAASARAGTPPRRGRTGLIAAVVALLLLGGVGYAVWLNADDFADLFAGSGPAIVVGEEEDTADEEVAVEDAVPAEDAVEDEVASEEAEAQEIAALDPAEASEAPAEAEPQKFTQRLLPDGREVDEGPAGEEPRIGEGTSIASISLDDSEEERAEAPGQVPVGQRAIFYEEQTGSADGSAETGSIVWRVVQESPGGDAAPEPAVRAEATIPGHNLQLRMTVRRNADQTLPASHIIEMIFLTPENFAGGAIDNVLRIAMKDTEEATGSPLLGIPAKIADGFFLIALSDTPNEVETNLALIRERRWIDIPVVYRSGRRALMTMEMGIPGERAFEEAIEAWEEASG